MTRDSTAPPPADAPPEPGSTVTVADPALEALPVVELVAAEAAAPVEQAPAAAPVILTEEGRPLDAPTHAPDIDPTKLDPDALKVVYRLLQHGHEAYFVGGCVRDLLLGLKPKDFDIATSAHPGEVRAIFRNCRLIGRRFRLAHVYFKGGKMIEVSTFRANPTELEEAQAELEAAQVETEGEALDETAGGARSRGGAGGRGRSPHHPRQRLRHRRAGRPPPRLPDERAVLRRRARRGDRLRPRPPRRRSSG